MNFVLFIKMVENNKVPNEIVMSIFKNVLDIKQYNRNI